MKTKHTPGPWKIEGQNIIGNEINGFICTWSGRKKDANLIAAAPDLLEACKHVLENLSEESEEVWEHEIAHLQYAIEKAEET